MAGKQFQCLKSSPLIYAFDPLHIHAPWLCKRNNKSHTEVELQLLLVFITRFSFAGKKGRRQSRPPRRDSLKAINPRCLLKKDVHRENALGTGSACLAKRRLHLVHPFPTPHFANYLPQYPETTFSPLSTRRDLFRAENAVGSGTLEREKEEGQKKETNCNVLFTVEMFVSLVFISLCSPLSLSLAPCAMSGRARLS